MSTKGPHSNKTLIIVRHAHREKELGRFADNGISEKGRKQARALSRYFLRKYRGEKVLICSSPRKRCMETVSEVAQKTKVPVEVMSDLEEGGDLEEKVKSFLRWWEEEAPPLTLVCSHGDWIPLCIEWITNEQIQLRKAGWAEIQRKGNQCRLAQVIQSWDQESEIS